MAPPRSPSAATSTAGGSLSTKRWGSIASRMRVRVGLAQADAQAAADDDGIDVEHVLHRGHAGAERRDRVVHELDGQLVAALQRARPDAARQPVAAAVAHDVEEVGLVALLLALAGADLHRAAAGVGLHAAAPPAGAARAVALDDDMADLAGGAAADPRAAVEDDAAADAGAPEHAEQRAIRAPGAEQRTRRRWRPGRRCPAHPRAERLGELVARGGSCPPSRAGCARWSPCPARRRRRRASRRRRRRARRSRRRPPRPPRCSAPTIAAATSVGPPLVGVGHARLAADLVVAVDDHRLDLRAAEVDAAAHGARVPAAPAVRSASRRRPTISA